MTSFKHFVGLTLGIVINDCIVRQPEGRSQILQATTVPAPDIIVRHMAAALRSSLAHTLDAAFRDCQDTRTQAELKNLVVGPRIVASILPLARVVSIAKLW
jgi:hypothetical protein